MPSAPETPPTPALTKPQRWALGVIARMGGATMPELRANGVNKGLVDRLADAGLVFVQTASRTVCLTDQGVRVDADESTAVHFDTRLRRYVYTNRTTTTA